MASMVSCAALMDDNLPAIGDVLGNRKESKEHIDWQPWTSHLSLPDKHHYTGYSTGANIIYLVLDLSTSVYIED